MEKIITNQSEQVSFRVTILLNTNVMVIKIKTYQLNDILINQTTPEKILNDLKKSDTQKIQLTKPIDFVSHRKTDEECVIDSKSNIIKIMINGETDEVVEELVQSLLSRYQIQLEI